MIIDLVKSSKVKVGDIPLDFGYCMFEELVTTLIESNQLDAFVREIVYKVVLHGVEILSLEQKKIFEESFLSKFFLLLCPNCDQELFWDWTEMLFGKEHGECRECFSPREWWEEEI